MADISITAANVALVSGSEVTGTAGGTITAGMPVYKKAADSELYAADCDVDAATAAVVGIALNSASDGQPLTYAAPGSVVNMGATLTVGEIYVLSGTAGGVAPEADLASDDYVIILGVGITAANLKFNLINSGVQIP